MINRGCSPGVKWAEREAYYHYHIVLRLRYTTTPHLSSYYEEGRFRCTVHLLSIAPYSVGGWYFVVVSILYLENTVYCIRTACFGYQKLFIFRIHSMCFV
jgi:hypothetical protein